MKKGLLLILASGVLLAGCHTDMWVQPKASVQGKSDFFRDGMDSRPVVPGTVARGQVKDDPAYFTGRSADGKLVTEIPSARAIRELKLENYADLLERGQERFKAFCSHCHGGLGDGKGMIAQRGLNLKRPVGNYHTDRLRNMAIGHFFEVMTHGQGAMFSMADKIDVPDRWAITTYIRALQRSQDPQAMEAANQKTQSSRPAQFTGDEVRPDLGNAPANAPESAGGAR